MKGMIKLKIIKECPICHSKLEEGDLRTIRDRIIWGQRDEKNSFFATNINIPVNNIQIGAYNFFKGSRAAGWRCKKCKTLFINEDY